MSSWKTKPQWDSFSYMTSSIPSRTAETASGELNFFFNTSSSILLSKDSDTNTVNYSFIYKKSQFFNDLLWCHFWGGHFYCVFYSEKALDLWFLSQFSQIVDSDPIYFIKRKMKGIRYISIVLHYSSCMKRQSKMAALHAAICTLNYSNAFSFSFHSLMVPESTQTNQSR